MHLQHFGIEACGTKFLLGLLSLPTMFAMEYFASVLSFLRKATSVTFPSWIHDLLCCKVIVFISDGVDELAVAAGAIRKEWRDRESGWR